MPGIKVCYRKRKLRARLDENFPVVVKSAVNRHRRINNAASKYFAQYMVWPHTGALTLFPVNISNTFVRTKHFESLKLRSSEFHLPPSFWSEVPRSAIQGQTNTPDKADYFLNCIVPKEAHGAVGTDILVNFEELPNQFGQILEAIRESQTPMNCAYTNEVFPDNQPFHIRFIFEGKSSFNTGDFMVFAFGQFMFRFTLKGLCYIYISEDLINYKYLRVERWIVGNVDRNEEYRISIFPHARNKVEVFVNYYRHDATHLDWPISQTPGELSYIKTNERGTGIVTYGFSFTVPDAIGTPLENGLGKYKITKPNKVYLFIGRSVRPFVQISRLAFYNSSSNQLPVYDHELSIERPITASELLLRSVDDKPSGTSILLNVVDGVSGIPLTGSTVTTQPKMGILMFGRNDIPNTSDPLSKTTPELYSYLIHAPAQYTVDSRTTVDTQIISARVDRLGDPESERCELVLDPTQCEANLSPFLERGYFPVRVYDDATGVVIFEGFSHSVEVDEAPASGKILMNVECRGMADRLLRSYIIDLDFTARYDSGLSYTWAEALLETFKSVGFPGELVNIERVAEYDFPLWEEGDENNGVSSGAKSPSAGQRWRPNPNAPIYQWQHMLIRDILGWHWQWTNATGVGTTGSWSFTPGHWSVFKRPRPMNLSGTYSEIDALPVKAAFFTNGTSLLNNLNNPLVSNVPCYVHSSKRKRSTAPEHTGVRGITWATNLGGKVADILANLGMEEKDRSPENATHEGFVAEALLNPNGCIRPGTNVNVNKLSPDYMGSEMIRTVKLMTAPNKTAFQWIMRRVYEDRCFGHTFTVFDADYGDIYTSQLKRWDKVLIDMVPHLVMSIDMGDSVQTSMRATYTCWKIRPGAAPPR